jgi:hypothetical protein
MVVNLFPCFNFFLSFLVTLGLNQNTRKERGKAKKTHTKKKKEEEEEKIKEFKSQLSSTTPPNPP